MEVDFQQRSQDHSVGKESFLQQMELEQQDSTCKRTSKSVSDTKKKKIAHHTKNQKYQNLTEKRPSINAEMNQMLELSD